MTRSEAYKEVDQFVKLAKLERNNASLWEALNILIPSEYENPYWARISDIAKKQREKGLQTYGVGIEENPLDVESRLDMLEEELVDVLMYLEWLRDALEGLSHSQT